MRFKFVFPFLLGCLLVTWPPALSADDAEASQYSTTPAQHRDITVTVTSPGSVAPENRLEIKPPIAGRVEEVLVEEGAKVKKGQKLAWMSSTERAALLDAASAKGSEEVKRWSDYYRPTPILAPINGTIIVRKVESGQTFGSQDAVFVMSDRLAVKAQVDETDISQIKLDQECVISLDSYPEVKIPGKVAQIAFDATTVNNVTTYVVDVVPLEVPEVMRSGMTASVNCVVEVHPQVLSLPSAALNEKEGIYMVLVPGVKPGQPNSLPVKVGVSNGIFTQILEGLREGQEVLVKSTLKLNAPGGGSPFSAFGPRRPRS